MPVYDAHVTERGRGAAQRRAAAALRQRIASGEWAVAAQMPSRRALAESLGVAVGTVDRALGMLADEGMIEVVPGSGTFVVSLDPRPQKTVAERVADLEAWRTDMERRLDRHEQEHPGNP